MLSIFRLCLVFVLLADFASAQCSQWLAAIQNDEIVQADVLKVLKDVFQTLDIKDLSRMQSDLEAGKLKPLPPERAIHTVEVRQALTAIYEKFDIKKSELKKILKSVIGDKEGKTRVQKKVRKSRRQARMLNIVLKKAPDRVSSYEFLPQGDLIAGIPYDREKIRFWDAKTGAILYQSPEKIRTSINRPNLISIDGVTAAAYAISEREHEEIFVWDIRTKKIHFRFKWKYHDQKMEKVTQLPDGRWVGVLRSREYKENGRSRSILKIVDLKTKEELHSTARSWETVEQKWNGIEHGQFHIDSETVVFVEVKKYKSKMENPLFRKRLIQWDYKKNETYVIMEGRNRHFQITNRHLKITNGSRAGTPIFIVTRRYSDRDGMTHAYDLKNREVLYSFESPGSIRVSQDEKLVAFVQYSPVKVALYEFGSDKLLRNLIKSKVEERNLHDFAFLSNGYFLLHYTHFKGEKGTSYISIWDPRSGKELLSRTIPYTEYMGISFDTMALIAENEREVRVWDIGQLLEEENIE